MVAMPESEYDISTQVAIFTIYKETSIVPGFQPKFVVMMDRRANPPPALPMPVVVILPPPPPPPPPQLSSDNGLLIGILACVLVVAAALIIGLLAAFRGKVSSPPIYQGIPVATMPMQDVNFGQSKAAVVGGRYIISTSSSAERRRPVLLQQQHSGGGDMNPLFVQAGLDLTSGVAHRKNIYPHYSLPAFANNDKRSL